ncbi:unnamed protein product [Spirodela intermedia]|uniref:Uncharacterized protein n=1 Tax=Spirodela intermedia TaxID=51605 RepID=A0A7I8JYW4_SPIIN|nr:unnamed protein product [Spirodela intermedia]
MATLSIPQPVPSPLEDAEALRKACQGWGTDEKAVIEILAHRGAVHRTQIRLAYKELYKEDLVKRLESELSGDFERAVYRWIFEPLEREVIIANIAVKARIDYRVIIETACINSPPELLAVKQAYQARYKRSLEEDVASHTSGDLRKFLVPLVASHRYGGEEVDPSLALTEARILHDAIKQNAFNHEEITRILTTRSRFQLNATFNRFKDEFGVSVTKGLSSSECPDDLLSSLRVAIRCISSPHKYLEKALRNALKKPGADADVLTRVITTRAEKDLKVIKELYLHRTNTSLDHAIAKETSNDYKSFLLALIGN